MSYELDGYGAASGIEQAKLARSTAITMKDRLTHAVEQAEQRLKAAKRAKELFDKNPDLEELLNIMQGGYF